MSEAGEGPGRRVVDGRFELEARLGGGGMGTVWRARDLALHRMVAVKEVRPPDPDLAEYDPDGARTLRERVLREARALARIDHPNVVTIHHIVDGGEGTYPWIVMELVTGGSLADRLAQGPMPPAEAARIGRGVLAALTAAHEADIQHRDVKPANVLLRPDGRPLLTDFGIAAIRETTSLTVTGSIIGTPDFMAPERISGHEGGSASDLWSLAMMLYAAVEGHHPLRRGNTLATLAAVLNDDVPKPARAGALGDVLMSVLVRDPAARPSSAALDRMLAGIESGQSVPTAPWNPQAPYPQTPQQQAAPPHAPAPTYTGSAPSYPGAFAAPTNPYGGAAAAGGATVPTGFGPPPVHPGPGPVMPQPVTSPVGVGRGSRLALRVVFGVAGTSLAGALVLMWWLLPLGNDSGGSGASADPGTSAVVPARESAGSPTAAPAGRQSEGPVGTSLLTPDGIRTAVAAIEKETGRDRFGDFTAYDDFVSVEVMVKGSDSKYDTYTYRAGRGVEKGIIKGSLAGGNQPFRLDGFDWDKVPVLLAEARKKLNVDDPNSSYVVVRPPNDTFDTPLGMAVYLSNEYSQAGYLEATPKGKVTRVMPAED
ncbi:serine/threonine-protein kinase [Streptomyces griseorubiginosus]|uniref:non-specific serine/threonine protein kinase n=1 Tax=Streptomyces griseorubiginosus TaxID=67304 RepID=A0AAI8L8M7_9ACTN|nr:serine/threonine-protein kinase [Streptomyces griseorubiginosus]AYC43412.1 Serine/threonine-protein kinase PK-1 [Streptomyces griseorubiginosus]